MRLFRLRSRRVVSACTSVLIVFTITCCPSPLGAAALSWTGNISNVWNLGGNWNTSSTPTASDTVRIGSVKPPSFRWPIYNNTTIDRTVVSVTVQGPNISDAAFLIINNGILRTSNNFRVGVKDSGNGNVTLSGTSTNLFVSGQIQVDAGSFMTNSGGANVSQTSSQPVLVYGQLRQITNNSADFNAVNMSVLSGGSYIQSTGRTAVSNTMLISGENEASVASSYSLQGTGISAGEVTAQFITIGDSTNGALILSGDATMTVTDTVTVNSGGLFDIKKDFGFDWQMKLNGGTVRAKDGSTLKTLTLYADALLSGSRTVDGNLANGWDIVAGSSSGTVGSFDVSGDYSQTSQGALFVDIAGTSTSQYDRLDVTGDVTLTGDLDVQFISSFAPSEGDQFDIIPFGGSHTGAFSNVTLPAASSGVALTLIYGATDVSLAAGIEGDLNLDGFVGLDDLDIVLNNWNTSVREDVWGDGDPSGDAFVGLDDLDIVLNNWNNGTPPSALSVVPEPTMLMLLGPAALGPVLRRGGSRQF